MDCVPGATRCMVSFKQQRNSIHMETLPFSRDSLVGCELVYTYSVSSDGAFRVNTVSLTRNGTKIYTTTSAQQQEQDLKQYCSVTVEITKTGIEFKHAKTTKCAETKVYFGLGACRCPQGSYCDSSCESAQRCMVSFVPTARTVFSRAIPVSAETLVGCELICDYSVASEYYDYSSKEALESQYVGTVNELHINGFIITRDTNGVFICGSANRHSTPIL